MKSSKSGLFLPKLEIKSLDNGNSKALIWAASCEMHNNGYSPEKYVNTIIEKEISHLKAVVQLNK